MNLLDITHPDDLAVDQDLFEELAAGRRDRYQVEKRFVSKDGRVLWGRLHVSLVRGPGGEPDFTVALVEDITARKQSQAALEESEERYRRLVHLSPEAVMVHADGKYVFANPAGAKLFGVSSPEELIGRQVLDLVHPDYRDQVSSRMNQARQGQQTELRQIKILRPDGQAVDVETTGLGIDYQGKPAVQVILRDITERLQAEREIRRQASFPELNPNPVLEVDQEGRVMYANPAALQTAEKLGLTEGVKAFLPPDLKELFTKASQGGPRQYSIDLALENRTYAVIVSFPHDLPTARLYSLDITKRQQAEQALRRSEERLLLAQQVAKIGTFEWNIQTGVNTWTPELEAMYGLPPGGFAGTQPAWEDLVHPDDRPEAVRRVKQAFETGEPVEGKWRVVWPDGSVHWLAGRWQVFKDEAGHPLRMTGMNIDITARQRAEESLRESEERHRSLFENNPAVVYLLDPETGDIVDANLAACKYYGYSREELLARKITSINTMKSEEAFRVMHQVKTRARQHFEFKHRLASGEVRDVEVFSGPIRLSGRELLYSIVHDITARKKAEAALRRVHDELEQRVAKRTASLRLANEQLLREIEERQRAEESLKDSERRLRYLAEQLLTAQENERKRLAAELHDELGHALLALKLHLGTIEKKLPPEQEAIKGEILARA